METENRKSRINLEKTYPPGYLERMREKLAREAVAAQQAYALTPTPTPQPAPSPKPTPVPQPKPKATPAPAPQPTPAPSKLGKGIDPKVTNKIMTGVFGCLVVLMVMGLCFAIYDNKERYAPEKPKEIKFICNHWDIYEILEHVDPISRILDVRGTVILDSMLDRFPNDAWLNFIDKKDNLVRSGQQRDSILFLRPVPNIPKKTSKPKYVKYDGALLSIGYRGYIRDKDILHTKRISYVDQTIAENAVKQFKRDSGLPMDADMNSKEVRNLISTWYKEWSTIPLGYREVENMSYGASDVDELIRLLIKADFLNISEPLTKRNFYSSRRYRSVDSKVVDFKMASLEAGCKERQPYFTYHYVVPQGLETCLRAFQAYHGIKPDGLLNDLTIATLQQYKY